MFSETFVFLQCFLVLLLGKHYFQRLFIFLQEAKYVSATRQHRCLSKRLRSFRSSREWEEVKRK